MAAAAGTPAGAACQADQCCQLGAALVYQHHRQPPGCCGCRGRVGTTQGQLDSHGPLLCLGWHRHGASNKRHIRLQCRAVQCKAGSAVATWQAPAGTSQLRWQRAAACGTAPVTSCGPPTCALPGCRDTTHTAAMIMSLLAASPAAQLAGLGTCARQLAPAAAAAATSCASAPAPACSCRLSTSPDLQAGAGRESICGRITRTASPAGQWGKAGQRHSNSWQWRQAAAAHPCWSSARLLEPST